MEATVARPLAADLRRLLWFRPEWPWALLAALAWLLLVLTGDLPLQGQNHVQHDSTSLSHWAAMVMAMILPATLPMVRGIAQVSLWRRRYHAPAVFIGEQPHDRRRVGGLHRQLPAGLGSGRRGGDRVLVAAQASPLS